MAGKTTASPIPGARVLVVDDEAHVRSALVRSLNLLGYRASGASSGAQALEILERSPYEAMVLDLRMPGMDGVQVMQRASQLWPNLVIIILTGHATLETAISAVRSHAADYLLKPASVHDVASAIANALGQSAVKLRRQRLLQVMEEALDEVRTMESRVRRRQHLRHSRPSVAPASRWIGTDVWQLWRGTEMERAPPPN